MFMGINESRHENTDDLIVERCNTNLGVDLAVEDIERSRRLSPKSLQDVAADGNSLGKRLKSRPVIVSSSHIVNDMKYSLRKRNSRGRSLP